MAYRDAKVEYFDEHSRYIFSVIHRGDSLSDEFSQPEHLSFAMNYYYYNGTPMWRPATGTRSEHVRFRHIRYAHSDIFITLKKFFDENRLIMLYGNHNMFLKNPEYVKKHYHRYYDEYTEKECDLFNGMVAHEALVLRSRQTGQEILAVHGHQGDLMNDQLWFVTMFMVRFFRGRCTFSDSRILPVLHATSRKGTRSNGTTTSRSPPTI